MSKRFGLQLLHFHMNFQDVAFDLEMERLKQEVEELRDIIKEAKTGFKKIKVPWYVTQFGDFILYLLIVSIISFIIIGPAYITSLYHTQVDFFLNEDQFCIFFSKLVRDIILILFYRNLWKICMGLNFSQIPVMTGYVIMRSSSFRNVFTLCLDISKL